MYPIHLITTTLIDLSMLNVLRSPPPAHWWPLAPAAAIFLAVTIAVLGLNSILRRRGNFQAAPGELNVLHLCLMGIGLAFQSVGTENWMIAAQGAVFVNLIAWWSYGVVKFFKPNRPFLFL